MNRPGHLTMPDQISRLPMKTALPPADPHLLSKPVQCGAQANHPASDCRVGAQDSLVLADVLASARDNTVNSKLRADRLPSMSIAVSHCGASDDDHVPIGSTMLDAALPRA